MTSTSSRDSSSSGNSQDAPNFPCPTVRPCFFQIDPDQGWPGRVEDDFVQPPPSPSRPRLSSLSADVEEARERVERLKEAVQTSHEALMEAEQAYKDCVASLVSWRRHLSALEATCRELGQELGPPRSEDHWEDASLTPPSGISV